MKSRMRVDAYMPGKAMVEAVKIAPARRSLSVKPLKPAKKRKARG